MLVSFCLEIVLILTQDRCMVCAECTIGSKNRSARPRWYSLVMWAMWNLFSFHLEIVLVSVRDRCMVCAKHTIDSEIILDAPDRPPR
jgi:hypothetical protein